ncbi:MAG: MarR family winged helix-turn-helix transcriptional regulator [Parvibaculaceae bacterium]
MVGRFGTALLKPANGDTDAIPSIGEIGLNHFAPYLINRISARWNADMLETLRSFDLTTAKMRTLAVLAITPGMTANDLALHTITEQSTMSRTLDAMEEQGLVESRPRKEDLRVREVYPTEKGRELFAAFWPAMYRRYSDVFSSVSEAEYESFISVLHKMLQNMNQA